MPDTLPTGTLTFLFTDIEGSTARWEHQRDAMSAALERHDAMLRTVIEHHNGHVFKTVGDAFYAAFADATDALSASLDAQRALATEDWSTFGSDFADLRVRMGLHHGKAEARGGDYFGPALNPELLTWVGPQVTQSTPRTAYRSRSAVPGKHVSVSLSC